MKHGLILAMVLCVGAMSGECSSVYFPPLQPQVQNQAMQSQENTLSDLNQADNFINPVRDSYSNLDKVELALFGKSYPKQNLASRLSRVEMALFTTTYPNSPSNQRIDNIISNFNQIRKYPNISKNTLSRLESKVLNQTFVQNNAERRIERLEEQVFGAAQSGDLNDRLKALQLASKTYGKTVVNDAMGNSMSDDFSMSDSGFSSPMTTTRAVNRGWGGIGGMLGNFAAGAMTGYTPQITPFSAYNAMSPFTNYAQRYRNPYYQRNPYIGGQGMQTGNQTNYGYSNGYRDYGTGAAVTILD